MQMLIDETLRKYPPAYIGPRRSIEPFEFQGVPVPGGAHIHYCSWASHHLPDVWPDPDRFDPHRFTAERRAQLEKGAYVPFGGGSRTCIGMRFGEAEIAIITRAVLSRFRLELRSRLPAEDPPGADDLADARPADDGARRRARRVPRRGGGDAAPRRRVRTRRAARTRPSRSGASCRARRS